MTISSIASSNKQLVAWLGESPPHAVASVFVDRDLAVQSCTREQLQDPKNEAGLKAAIFPQSPSKLTRIATEISTLAPLLLDFGCQVVVRPTINGTAIVAKAIASAHLPCSDQLPAQRPQRIDQGPDSFLPQIRIFQDGVPWKDVANYLVTSESEPAPNRALNIADLETLKLSPERVLLIQRAFANCVELHLRPELDGRSRVSVYRAYADRGGLNGRWVRPYFVKIGQRAKILAEYLNYELRVAPYVPFHLGPHLAQSRCCLGARSGIIVGDLVEEAESLLDCAGDGRAAAAIACLFDRTLRAWHRAPHVSEGPFGSLLPALRAIPKQTLEFAERLGAVVRNVEELEKPLRDGSKAPAYVGEIHGDLHAGNVLVRSTDAILIDFYSSRTGPLLSDAASLEASLLVSGFRDDGRNPEQWFQSVAPLYEEKNLNGPPPHGDPRDQSGWFYNCVRQIRMYARQVEYADSQYRYALASALLFKASKEPDPSAAATEVWRRAGAYVLAERLLTRSASDAS